MSCGSTEQGLVDPPLDLRRVLAQQAIVGSRQDVVADHGNRPGDALGAEVVRQTHHDVPLGMTDQLAAGDICSFDFVRWKSNVQLRLAAASQQHGGERVRRTEFVVRGILPVPNV
jgi:hypothetical protein